MPVVVAGEEEAQRLATQYRHQAALSGTLRRLRPLLTLLTLLWATSVQHSTSTWTSSVDFDRRLQSGVAVHKLFRRRTLAWW